MRGSVRRVNGTMVTPVTDEVVALFHPRREHWHDHFQLNPDGSIKGKTATERVTVTLLDFNHPSASAFERR